MTKRIFKYISGFVFILYLVILTVTISIFYDNLRTQTQSALKTETMISAYGVEQSGEAYFENLNAENYRITWISGEGKVLYDSSSKAEELGSHLDREEIKKAFETGMGESSRYSDTIMARQYYCAKLLSDGTVVRLSISHDSVVLLLIKLIYPIAYSSLAILGVCVFVAYQISKKIVQPINEINLDEPKKNSEYKEIQPLLSRIEQQQNSIKWQEIELRRRRDEFNAVTYGMKEGLILLGEENQILSTNRAASAVLEQGVSIEKLLKTDLLELEEKTYRVDVSPVSEQGSIILLQDITEKDQAERLRREFTSNVSHELKTPLQSISGRAELLMTGLVKEEDRQGFIEQIYGESKRMITLVEDIIGLSSLEENSDFIFEPVDLWASVRETAYSLKEQANKAGVLLSVDGSPVTIPAVPRLVNVIIYNLIDNAIKYNKAQGSVAVTLKEDTDKVLLQVKDTGIGIPYEAQERVFERFYRVDKSRSKSVGGTGLGLSIVKHASKILGAEIEMKSTLNEGTTICVNFKK